MKNEYESYDSFITDLRLKARTCNFGVLVDSLIRDQVVYGTDEDRDREKLLSEWNLDLEKTIKICHAGESTRLHMKYFRDKPSPTISGTAEARELRVR